MNTVTNLEQKALNSDNELRVWSTKDLYTELAALRRDGAKGFWDHDACTRVELELQRRGK
jgi:hypothetical protein